MRRSGFESGLHMDGVILLCLQGLSQSDFRVGLFVCGLSMCESCEYSVIAGRKSGMTQ